MHCLMQRLLLFCALVGLGTALQFPFEAKNHNVSRFVDDGPILPAERTSFTVVLKDRVDARSLLAGISDKKNTTHFGKWLTAQELLALTQPAASDFTIVETWLNQAGVSCTRRSFSFRCNATEVGIQALFGNGVHLGRYKDRMNKNRTIIRVKPADASLLGPHLTTNHAAVDNLLLSIVGLTEFPHHSRVRAAHVREARMQRRLAEFREREAARKEQEAELSFVAGLGRRLQDLTSSFSSSSAESSSSGHGRNLGSFTAVFTLEVMKRLYNIPSSINGIPVVGNASQGIMAIELNGAYTSLPNNILANYNQQNGVGTAYAGVSYSAGPLGPSSGQMTFNQETSLDLQIIGAVPYPSPVWIYNDQENAPWGDAAEDIISAQAAGQPYPQVLSISWGESEIGMSQADIGASENAFYKVGLLGVTIVVASGDNGAQAQGSCYGGPSVSYPCSSAYVLCVGGTEPAGSASNSFSALGNPSTPICQNPPSGYKCYQPQSEVVCSSGDGNGITSGGGFSTLVPIPSWQAATVQSYVSQVGASNLAAPNGISQAHLQTRRATPDMSANAASWLIEDWAGNCNPYGPCIMEGTSAAAPLVASIIALANSVRASSGLGPLGFVTPLIYELYSQFNASGQIFNDVIQGNNRCLEQGSANVNCPSGCAGYNAVPGYDAVTGVGTPNANGLLLALVGATPPAVPPYSWVPPAESSGLTTAAVIGICIGALAVIVIVAVACCYCGSAGCGQTRGKAMEPNPGYGNGHGKGGYGGNGHGQHQRAGAYPMQQYAPYGPSPVAVQPRGYGV